MTRSSFESCLSLFAIVSEQTGRTEMADIEQTQQMIPLVTCEISFGQYVCESVFGVNVLDLVFGVQADSIE